MSDADARVSGDLRYDGVLPSSYPAHNRRSPEGADARVSGNIPEELREGTLPWVHSQMLELSRRMDALGKDQQELLSALAGPRGNSGKEAEQASEVAPGGAVTRLVHLSSQLHRQVGILQNYQMQLREALI